MEALLSWLLCCGLAVEPSFSLVRLADQTRFKGASGGEGQNTLDVISFESTENDWKESFPGVEAYARLVRDPTASLDSSFTLCSTISSPTPEYQVFFTLLDTGGGHFLSAAFNNNEEKQGALPVLAIGHKPTYHYSNVSGWLFPTQWVRSCLAVSTDSGLVRWVVDGQLVEDRLVDTLQEASGQRPTDLTGAILLGTMRRSSGWKSNANKVTNLNVFSSVLPIERMVNMTSGVEECEKENMLLGCLFSVLNYSYRIQFVL